ncbi:MAG: glycogen debranching protein, partial [Cytophagaceae bacterium]
MKTVSVLVLAYSVHQAQALLDADALSKQYFGNDAPWYRDRIPFFESSDKDITDVYYYRWNIFRAHQRDLGANGFISTEFLDDVGWQTSPWASLNDATGFHILEGRWCRDRRFKEDYATFILGPNSNTRQFSESMAAAVWQGFLVDGVAEDAIARLDRMTTVFDAWSDSFDTSKGLYYVEPIRDATEYTISSIDASNGTDGFLGGFSFRPSINSYQYDNAISIAKLARLKGGEDDTATTYDQRAADIKSRVQNDIWNSTFEHFTDRYQVDNQYVKYWDFIRGRELV